MHSITKLNRFAQNILDISCSQPVNFHISLLRYLTITKNDRNSVGALATAQIKTNT